MMKLLRSAVVAGTAALVLVAVVVTAGGHTASACSCVGFADREAFGRADAVFTGTLVDIEELSNENYSSTDPQRFMFEVTAVFKGRALAQQTIVTAQGGESCGLEVTGPGPFIVFATTEDSTVSGAERGELYSNLCGGTRAIADGDVPAAFGAGRPPAGVDASNDMTGSDGLDVRWLILLVATAVAMTITVAVVIRRRHTGVP